MRARGLALDWKNFSESREFDRFLVGSLAPPQVLSEIDQVNVVTLQALSGAGYPGVSAFDLLGNIIPHIGGGEEKIRLETKKILGSESKPAEFGITVHVN